MVITILPRSAIESLDLGEGASPVNRYTRSLSNQASKSGKSSTKPPTKHCCLIGGPVRNSLTPYANGRSLDM